MTDTSRILSGTRDTGGASDHGGFFLSQHGIPAELRDATDDAASPESDQGREGFVTGIWRFLDAVDEAPTIGAIEEGLGIGCTELEIGDDVGLARPDGESLKACCGGNRPVMTGNNSRTLRHSAHHIVQKD